MNFIRIEGLGPDSSIPSSFTAIFEIRSLIKTFNPDIVNTHTARAGAIGRLASIGLHKKIKVIHTYHGHVFNGYFGKARVLIIKLIEKFLGRLTDYFFIVGESVREDLIRMRIISSTQSMSVWPAVKDFGSLDSLALRDRFGIPRSAFVVGWLGRKVPIKRLDKIINLAISKPMITFVIAGAGKKLDELYPMKMADRKLDNLIELGFITPREFWPMVDIGILTSDNEGIPSAPIEAALSKKPSILVDAGSVNEVVIPGITGILCGSDLQSISNSIDYFLQNMSLREEMGQKARDFVLEKFDSDKMVERHIEGYKRVLDRHTKN